MFFHLIFNCNIVIDDFSYLLKVFGLQKVIEGFWSTISFVNKLSYSCSVSLYINEWCQIANSSNDYECPPK
jgi:hypothetical protein